MNGFTGTRSVGKAGIRETLLGEMPPSPLHVTTPLSDDAVHCLQDLGTPAGPPVDAAAELPVEATLLTSTHLGQTRWTQYTVPRGTV